MEPLELETHPLLARIEKAGLDFWWGNFSVDSGEEYYMFIGKELGMLGGEFSASATMDSGEVLALFQETETKLKIAGFNEKPSLIAQWQPDF